MLCYFDYILTIVVKKQKKDHRLIIKYTLTLGMYVIERSQFSELCQIFTCLYQQSHLHELYKNKSYKKLFIYLPLIYIPTVDYASEFIKIL